jgi:hypothetical protein
MITLNDLERYPGGELIRQGILDIQAGQLTPCACLIKIGFPVISKAGLISPETKFTSNEEGELTLYRLLREEAGDAYSRYNALIRQLVSFERAIQ